MNTEKTPKIKLADKIKSVSNILIAVSRDPSVDELSAALGLTFLLDKMDKHATAVFSGELPPAINFLEPEKTFEDNADSLRDFIISLDKEKADRLRYKVEGNTVKVFITPYKTKITTDDLNFTEGDFNVELVVAIGVDVRDDLDGAIAAHGRILHDATVATLLISEIKDSLGSISWRNENASSYSEMVAELAESLNEKDKSLVDEHIATALLTGVVSATDQFRNEKTSPNSMTLAANLMAKGANQQLIASELSAANDEENDTQNNKNDNDSTKIDESKDDSNDHAGEIMIGHSAPKSKTENESTDNENNSIKLNAEKQDAEIPDEKKSESDEIAPTSPKVDPLQAKRNDLVEQRNQDALSLAQDQLSKMQQDIVEAPELPPQSAPKMPKPEENIPSSEIAASPENAPINANLPKPDDQPKFATMPIAAEEIPPTPINPPEANIPNVTENINQQATNLPAENSQESQVDKLDELIKQAHVSSSAMDDLRATVENNVDNSTTSAPQSRSAEYIQNDVPPPLNAALMNDNPQLVNPFANDVHEDDLQTKRTVIQPLAQNNAKPPATPANMDLSMLPPPPPPPPPPISAQGQFSVAAAPVQQQVPPAVNEIASSPIQPAAYPQQQPDIALPAQQPPESGAEADLTQYHIPS